jgi:hypothetical protein
MDIHLEKGMHCIDCHFNQDNHGNTKLYGEVEPPLKSPASIATAPRRKAFRRTGRRQADAHFRPRRAKQRHGPLAPPHTPPPPPAAALSGLAHRWGQQPGHQSGDDETVRRRLIQRSMVDENRQWVVTQTKDTIRPAIPLTTPSRTRRRQSAGGTTGKCSGAEQSMNMKRSVDAVVLIRTRT